MKIKAEWEKEGSSVIVRKVFDSVDEDRRRTIIPLCMTSSTKKAHEITNALNLYYKNHPDEKLVLRDEG